MRSIRTIASVAAMALMGFCANATPILVGTWGSGQSSGDAVEIVAAQQAINAYNALPGDDLPNLANISDPNNPVLLLNTFVAKTTAIGPYKSADGQTLIWTAPADYQYYYVLTKWGQGTANYDTALHYLLAGDSVNYNPGGSGPPKGLSHIIIWSGGTNVPDGGATVCLLGGAMLALGALQLRRKH